VVEEDPLANASKRRDPLALDAHGSQPLRMLTGTSATPALRRIDEMLAAAARQLIRPQAEREAQEASRLLADALARIEQEGSVGGIDRLKVGALLALRASASFRALAGLSQDAMDNHMALVWEQAAARAEALIEQALERRTAQILEPEDHEYTVEEVPEHERLAQDLEAQMQEAARLSGIAATVGRAMATSPVLRQGIDAGLELG
jgi:hypothetical protein